LPAALEDPTYRGVLSYALLDGFTRARGRSALVAIAAAVAMAGGVVVDFGVYDGEAVRMSAELEADALAALGDALEREGVHLFESSRVSLEGARGKRPVVALLHIAFA
jgi:hypothetical protein